MLQEGLRKPAGLVLKLKKMMTTDSEALWTREGLSRATAGLSHWLGLAQP